MGERDGRVASGVDGLDEVLNGGFPRGRIMLVEGQPGTGKTTLALQTLIAARDRGEKTLFLSIAQSVSELRMIADSHGLDLSGIEIVSPPLEGEDARDSVSVETHASQLIDLMHMVDEKLAEVEPDLFVFDSLLELRLLASNEYVYRRETLNLRQRLREKETTALLLDHLEPQNTERHAEGIAHGVIRLDAAAPPIGITHRRLHVLKMRGSPLREGYHDFRIGHGGLKVFPRVVPALSGDGEIGESVSSRIDELDELLGGGLEYGTATLIAGQSGTGKSALSGLFAHAAAASGARAGLFLFEERAEVFRHRSRGLGLPLDEMERDGRVELRHYDPAEISPGEFSRSVIERVEENDMRVVVIDSLSGYLYALPDRENVLTHLYALIQYLARRGVLVILTIAQHGLLGELPRTQLDVSYIADSILQLRQYAASGVIRRSVAVVKKRHSEHDRHMRELILEPGAIRIADLSADLRERVRTDSLLGGL